MPNYIKHDLIQGSQEWLDFRKNKIGASMIPAICNVSPYQSRNQLLKEFVTGEVKAVNDFTQKIFDDGHEWEDAIRNKVNEPRDNKFLPAVVQYEKDSLFFASLDGINEEFKKVLETKSTSVEKVWMDVSWDNVPDEYNFQIQWQLFVTGYDSALLAVVNKESGEVLTLDVKRDQKLIDKIYDQVKEFLKEVESSKQLATIESDDVNLKYIAESKKVVSEYQKLIDAEEEKIKTMSEELLKKYDANCIIGHNVKIEYSERKGAINYGEIEALREIDLEPYRKPSSRFVKITVQKEQKKVGNDNDHTSNTDK